MLREEQIHRYARHIVLGDVGVRGQEALLAASVTVAVGEARASSHCALVYLAAAGVGTLVIVGDTTGLITTSEVARSLILASDDVGQPRLVALRERLGELNPDVIVRAGADDATASRIEEHLELAAAIAAGASVATRTIQRIASQAQGDWR